MPRRWLSRTGQDRHEDRHGRLRPDSDAGILRFRWGIESPSPLGQHGQRVYGGRADSRQVAQRTRRCCDKDGSDKDKAADTSPEIKVVLVADIDPLYRDFFDLRAQGYDPDRELNLNADNVTFVLNTLDDWLTTIALSTFANVVRSIVY